MIKRLMLAAAIFALGASGAAAATPSLTGTRWQGDESFKSATHAIMRLEFDADGVLTSQTRMTMPPDPTWRTPKDSTWTQTGAVVTFQFNNEYIRLQGVIKGDTITGSLVNREHDTGSFVLHRVVGGWTNN